MKENSTLNILYPLVGGLIGMASGFTIFLITEQIVLMIVFIATGLTLGMTLGSVRNNEKNK